MIAQLTGDILQTQPPKLTVLVGGIGYEIFCPLSAFNELNAKQQTLYTQLIIKEDAHTLYGFLNLDDKQIFNELIKVNGVGAKVALAILSTLTLNDILTCIEHEDYQTIQQTPGIGKKTAQKIIVELKDRVFKIFNGQYSGITSNTSSYQQTFNQALSALLSLNFKEKEARAMLANIDKTLSTQDMIKSALKSKK